MEPKVYLITGCSSGLGVYLAKAALATGAKVIATARNPTKNQETYQDLLSAGATWLPLDVSSPDLNSQVQAAINVHGRVDVLINNAGLGGTAGPVEDTPLSEAMIPFETNFWGTVRVTQAVLPTMRAQKLGCMVNVSSSAVYDLIPGLGFYTASKAALDAMSACMAQEVASFGVKVLLVTPGAMRTPFLASDKSDGQVSLTEAYKDGPVAMAYGILKGMDGKQPIDPVKAAEAMVKAAVESFDAEGMEVIRLPIGVMAGYSMLNRTEGLTKRIKETEGVWQSMDYPEGQ